MATRSKDLEKLPSFTLGERTNFCQGWKWTQWGKWATFGAFILVVTFLTNPFGVNSTTWHLEGSTMGTFYTVTYRSDIASSKLKPVLENHLSDIEGQLSNWDKDSWISRFNRSDETAYVPIPPHAYRVVKHSLELFTQTNHALDPTLGNLVNLWGFGPSEADRPPDAQLIRGALEATGAEKLILKDGPPRIAKAHPALQLNVSAVAKGYAADVLAQQLELEGITDYLVNIGGEMRTSGRPENRSSWKVAIQRPDPNTRDGQAHVTINLITAGLATSGDYRRFLEIDGQRYPHILDPKTGWPIQTDLASATIIAPTSMQADGIATACLVLGLQNARELIERTPDAEGLFIQRIKQDKFRTFTTSGWPGSRLQSRLQKDMGINTSLNAQVP